MVEGLDGGLEWCGGIGGLNGGLGKSYDVGLGGMNVKVLRVEGR